MIPLGSKRTAFPLFGALALVSALVLTGCREGEKGPQPRTYTEIDPAWGRSPADPMAGAALPTGSMNAGLDIGWTTPPNWIRKDSASSLRSGSYSIPPPADLALAPLDLSITQLSGAAGGPAANLSRWMGQVGIKAQDKEVEAFIAKAPRFRTRTGEEGIWVDLTAFLAGDLTETRSIMGALIPGEGFTVFVKALGDKGLLQREGPVLRDFCASLSIRKAP